MSTSVNQKSQMQHYYLQQALADLKERVEDQYVFADFDEFSNLEEIIDGCLQVVSSSHIQQYERLCELYIRKVIKGIQLTSKSATRRYTEKGSYFHEQSLKIKDTDHYHFLSQLLEYNFLDLTSKLYLDVKEYESEGHRQEQKNKYQQLIKSDNLIKKQCIGCNQRFIQFCLIKGDARQYGYELQFLKSLQYDQYEGKQNKTSSRVFNFKNPDNQVQVLRKMIKLLNKNGGFICIGCKEIQQFKGVKDHYSCYQLRKTFMEGYIVMGDLCNLEKQEEIKSIIASICKKITPKVEFGKNITVSFRPIIYSPYKLGFNLQEPKKQENLVSSKDYCIILIKVHPTAKGEYYQDKGSQQIFQQDEDYMYDEFHDSDDQAGRRESEAEIFFNLISMSKEDLERQKCGQKTKNRSYFDSHSCI